MDTRLRRLLVGVLAMAWGMTGSALAEPPTGKQWVYVGTYTGANSKGIYLYELDLASGALTEKGLVAETKNPSFLAIHPDKHHLYAVGEIDDFNGKGSGAVNAYAIDGQTG